MPRPITLYGHGECHQATGPNPWKVAIVLEELNISYDHKLIASSDLKKEPFKKLNPNGRAPAIEDPNTNITLWESAAIIEYIKYHIKQWLYFKMSGQGPYFEQAAWFNHLHSEKMKSTIEKYYKQVIRVLYVLDKGKQYLVGEKCNLASFEIEKKYPAYHAWNERLLAQSTVKKVLAAKSVSGASSKRHN
ncbi:hypothetical protein B0O99DRAFT_662927 [Bisporella sp. PMI_857]|nr:hypothetical protein B0O99DRAFT_662927 [Bisporella sp. PMI_857]